MIIIKCGRNISKNGFHFSFLGTFLQFLFLIQWNCIHLKASVGSVPTQSCCWGDEMHSAFTLALMPHGEKEFTQLQLLHFNPYIPCREVLLSKKGSQERVLQPGAM